MKDWMPVADEVGKMSRCALRQVGAILLDRNDRVVATGYNGAPASYHHDTGGSCRDWCPRAMNDEQTAEYDNCCSIHAELNSLLFADRTRCEGGTIVVSSVPCLNCAKAISNSGVVKVVTRLEERDAHRKPMVGIAFMRDSGLEVEIR